LTSRRDANRHKVIVLCDAAVAHDRVLARGPGGATALEYIGRPASHYTPYAKEAEGVPDFAGDLANRDDVGPVRAPALVRMPAVGAVGPGSFSVAGKL
jgi:hypothetical protein